MDERLFRSVIEGILGGSIRTREDVDLAKRELCEKLGLTRFIRNSEILRYARPSERRRLLFLLQKKPSRTLSGVAVVAAIYVEELAALL